MHIQGVWKISIQENLVDAARRRKNDCIIDALIKMMLIDDHIDPREHAKISEIYYHLFGEKPEPDYIEKRSFEILREEDLEQISEVGKVVAESLKDKNPKEIATQSLVEVMLADNKREEEEIELLDQILKLWGTESILKTELERIKASSE